MRSGAERREATRQLVEHIDEVLAEVGTRPRSRAAIIAGQAAEAADRRQGVRAGAGITYNPSLSTRG